MQCCSQVVDVEAQAVQGLELGGVRFGCFCPLEKIAGVAALNRLRSYACRQVLTSELAECLK